MTDGGPPVTCSDGTLSGDETDVDCGGSCDACPLDADCNVNADCVSLRCTGGTCRAPETCFDFELTEGETDVDCGGPVCPGCPLMGACVVDSDCGSGNCAEGFCIAECDDGIRNGNESDVDCGGSCDGCAGGLRCAENEDCASALCEGSECADAACSDGVQNGTETDVDCGGACGPCAGGLGCAVDSDCVTLVCMGEMCAATSCTNGIRDADESDVDCGGATCPGCLPGAACGSATDCGGNPCTGGACVSGASCLDLIGIDASLGDGVYTIEPTEGDFHRVYCDMTTEGGGWTLVGSTENDPLNDQASSYYPDLQTLFPERANQGVWSGLRPVVGERADVRFACKRNPRSSSFNVDLVFFSNDFYQRMTAGRDSETCFYEEEPMEGDNQIIPARANELQVDTFRRSQEPYQYDGRLVGEDACGDPGDFTVDFDDRGMGGNQSDGTDWGESNLLRKCGTSGLGGGSWFVFVREANPTCADGVMSSFESGVDCGGPCGGCPDGGPCVSAGDCQSLSCSEEGTCLSTCENGFLDPDESDVDCGGACPNGCQLRQDCSADTDCDSVYICDDGSCLPSHCSNGETDGDETDLDCGGSCRPCEAGLACSVDADCIEDRCLGGTCALCAGDIFAETGSYIACETTTTDPTCPDSSGGTGLSLSDDSSALVTLPFTFEFYGDGKSSVYVGSNGIMSFGAGITAYSNSCIDRGPLAGTPRDRIFPFWDDLYPPTGGRVTYNTFGTSPNRQFVVSYQIYHISSSVSPIDVRVMFTETSNELRVCYVDTDTGSTSYSYGRSATSGIQGDTESIQYSCNAADLTEGLELVYTPL